jgi:hypothetical protein
VLIMRSQEARDEHTLLVTSWLTKVVVVLGLLLAPGAISDWLL